MKYTSYLPCSIYLYEMKQQMGSFTEFGIERLTNPPLMSGAETFR